jgi:hypothetical protein
MEVGLNLVSFENLPSDCCSVNKYEEADRILANCFKHSASQPGGEGEPQGEEETADSALAMRFVEMLLTEQPMNVAGLEQLVKRKEELILGEAEVFLDAPGFLQVGHHPISQPPHRMQAVPLTDLHDEGVGCSTAVQG